MRSSLDFKMRLFRIDQMIHDNGSVCFEKLQQALGCSAPTLKRDLRYLRDVLHAPIVYSRATHGYSYENGASPRLPKAWYSPMELFTLLTTLDLFERVESEENGLLCGEMSAMKSRLLSLIQDDKLPARELRKRFRVLRPMSRAYENPFFEVIGRAVAQRKRLQIVYFSKSRATENLREVSPMRLVNYKNRWYLDAWCHASDALKTFNLDNVRVAQMLQKRCKAVAMRDVEKTLDSTYGLFSRGVAQLAVIEIDSAMGAYVKDEIWHVNQKLERHTDGSLTLQVPYAQETELIGQILRLGAHARVVSPPGLRRGVQMALREMLAVYASDRS